MSVTYEASPPLADIRYVMRNLREMDRAECSATSFTENPDDWANGINVAGAFQWCAYYNGVPTAIWGATPRWPGVWSAWCLGTEDFPHVALTVTKHIIRILVPTLRQHGLVRCDCYVYQPYVVAHRWMAFLAATPEAVLENWGKNGETFTCYVWLRDEAKSLERTAEANMSEFTHGLPV